jgi:spermidine synthase
MPWPAQLLVSTLFLLSGATALVYQVTWLRNLTLIFGASFQATSILLAAFMAGLCVGGFAAGRWSEKIRRPLRGYGLLEFGVAGFALSLPFLLDLVDAAYVRAALAEGGVTPELNLVRSVMAFSLLLLPTLLMGATLPLLMTALAGRYRSVSGHRSCWPPA